MTDLISFVPPATNTATSASSSAASLADNFDTFLTILTAQIQNQDPLEPLDSTQFTEQLVQFSGVEQQIRTNQSMETLIAATRSSAGASLSGYLGDTAEIDASGAAFSGEPVTWRFALPRDAVSNRITVTNASGEVLYSQDGPRAAGSHEFEWSGQLTGGETAEPGAYYINVVATDSEGARITADHSVMATVTGVDLTYGEPALTTTSGVYAYSDIRRFVLN